MNNNNNNKMFDNFFIREPMKFTCNTCIINLQFASCICSGGVYRIGLKKQYNILLLYVSIFLFFNKLLIYKGYNS